MGIYGREKAESVRQILLHSPEGEFSKTDEKRLDIAKLYTRYVRRPFCRAPGETRRQNSLHIYMGLQEYSGRYFCQGCCQPLGKETLERSTYFNTGYYYNRQKVSKKNSMSHLLQACVPDANDKCGDFEGLSYRYGYK